MPVADAVDKCCVGTAHTSTIAPLTRHVCSRWCVPQGLPSVDTEAAAQIRDETATEARLPPIREVDEQALAILAQRSHVGLPRRDCQGAHARNRRLRMYTVTDPGLDQVHRGKRGDP